MTRLNDDNQMIVDILWIANSNVQVYKVWIVGALGTYFHCKAIQIRADFC